MKELDQYLIPISEIEKTESVGDMKIPDIGFFFFGNGWDEWVRYCVFRNIAFRLYQRYDMGGSDGEFLQVKEEDHKNELKGFFDLEDAQIGSGNKKMGSGAFMLLKTNCNPTFEIPPKHLNRDSSKFLFYNKHLITEEIRKDPYQLGKELRKLIDQIKSHNIPYPPFRL